MTKTSELRPDFSFGGLIRSAREGKGMSRTKLAEFADIPPNSLVRYEKAGEEGGKYPPLQIMVRLSRILEIDPRWAFQRIMEREEPSFTDSSSENRFNFPVFFQERNEGWKFENILAELQGLLPALHDLDARMQSLETRVDVQGMDMKSGPDRNDPSRSPKTHSGAVPAAPGHQPKPKEAEDDQE